jgi:hypothetical protein
MYQLSTRPELSPPPTGKLTYCTHPKDIPTQVQRRRSDLAAIPLEEEREKIHYLALPPGQTRLHFAEVELHETTSRIPLPTGK